jgi:hypothetical protein
MIPIYDAFLLEEKNLIGGSTKPLLLSVNTENGFDKYVVKVFTNKQDNQYAPLANEIYSHFLAKEFDIRTPDIALIKFSKSFIKTLPKDVKMRTQNQGTQLYFGSKYHDGFVQYIAAKHHRAFDVGDIETIFAFDILVRNIDRRGSKPNLLINNNKYLAIDHELCLGITKTFDEYYNANEWQFIGGFRGQKDRMHIFKSRLNRIAKNIDFSVIHEYLKVMNTKKILDCAEFLNYHNLNMGNIGAINSYLCGVKNRNQEFIKLCKSLIA